MPNDIEDFLKRAAERRQAKSAQAAPPVPTPPPRAEYTNSRAERLPRNRVDNDVPMQAILIDDSEPPLGGVADHMKAIKQQRKVEADATALRRAGGTVKPTEQTINSPYVAPDRAPSVAPQSVKGDNAGFTVADRLVTMLRQPEGMMQAILLQEILNRPEHRW